MDVKRRTIAAMKALASQGTTPTDVYLTPSDEVAMLGLDVAGATKKRLIVGGPRLAFPEKFLGLRTHWDASSFRVE